MRIYPIQSSATYKGLKISNSAKLTDFKKSQYIENIMLTSAFDNFEKSLRKTMEAFVYLVKVKYKG